LTSRHYVFIIFIYDINRTNIINGIFLSMISR